ncbi:MAG: AAC(3) family N-acetyltransferase, partial [Caldilineaceae bacterium]|nr:AAC(3) family N-acetyltransferase [Caldilineaceae bacterium]
KQLRACGLAEGQTVLVHMAMSKLGWIIGGAEAVIPALLAAVGDSNTMMMTTNSSNNTSLYLAEFRADYPGKRNLFTGSAMLVNGQRQWVAYETPEGNPDDFGALGTAFDAAHSIAVRQIDTAEVRFFRQRQLVNFAVAWMEAHRDFGK